MPKRKTRRILTPAPERLHRRLLVELRAERQRRHAAEQEILRLRGVIDDFAKQLREEVSVAQARQRAAEERLRQVLDAFTVFKGPQLNAIVRILTALRDT